MPLHALRLGARYSLLGLLAASATIAVALRAADRSDVTGAVTESFDQIAERFGLWAALSLLLVVGAVYALYQQSVFVQRTLVELVRANQRCIDRNTEALRDAPCGLRQAGAQDVDHQITLR